MTLRFGVFDHIEPVPGLGLDRIYRERLLHQQRHREHPNRPGGVALAGTPAAVREYMDEYVATGANYFVCSFQWGDLSHEQAMRSVELFATEVMPHYARPVTTGRSAISP